MWKKAKNQNQVLEAVSKPERLRIVQALYMGPLPLKALKNEIGRGYSDLLHHLSVLEKANLVSIIRLKPRLTMAYLRNDVNIKIQSGGETVVKLQKREPPVESELMQSYWKLLLQH